MKKLISGAVLLLALIICFSCVTVSAKTTYAIAATPAVTDAAYRYLDEIYIEKHPELALEYSFGSEKDRNTLKALAEKITVGQTSDKQKTKAIVSWVSENIQYKSYHSNEAEYFAIDTYYAKKGNCLGISQLIVQLCRLSNVKAVMCCGTRGNMEEYISLNGREMDHAWVMAYHGGDWYLYDPLFSVNGNNNKSFISKWYFIDMIEGVSPYVKKYASYINYGNCIFYINGRFVHYVNGIPASDFYNMSSEGGMSVNGALPYFTKNKDSDANCVSYDGFYYLENPSRKDSMIKDECYHDGWIGYGASMYYAKPNGILAGSTLKEYKGECYYLPYGSDAVKLPGKSTDYTFTEGFPTLMKGEKITIRPNWADAAIADDKVIVWKSETPETVSVTKDGVITALADGYACLSVCSKESYDSDTHHSFSFVEFWVSSKERKVTYITKTDASALNIRLSSDTYTYNGNTKTPSVTVKTKKGKTLKEGKDYTVKYDSGRKNVGRYSVTITFKGDYKGTKKLYFEILPGRTSELSVTASTKSLKAKWKEVKGAEKYKVQLISEKGKVLKTKYTSKTAYTFDDLSKGKAYKIVVTAYSEVGGKKFYSEKSRSLATATKPATPKLTLKADGKKQLTASWKAISGASGYEVQYSTSADMKGAKTVKKTSEKAVIKKLKKGKKYYVRVRAYKTVNNKKVYSGWSTVKNVKIR